VGTRARARGAYVSITETLVDLAKRGVDVRILHGGVPSGPFKRALAGAKLPMRHCPRQHMKLVIQDGTQAYLGSANLTGAGLGAKGEGRRNFEAGMVLTHGPAIETLQRQFDRVWRGQECASCKLRAQCPKPIDLLHKAKRAPAAKKST
jgi:phosphatidylserine/phosphatidylglycerophosphate/cardiolipin synthase-like enzyme